MRYSLSIGSCLVLAAHAMACSSQPDSQTPQEHDRSNLLLPPGARFRPPLEGDPLSYTPEELARGDYPPRPDPDTAPDAYADWLNAVTVRTRLITPEVEPLDAQHTTMTTNGIWSGFMNTAPSGQYTAVTGRWTVPHVNPDPSNYTQVSIWVGIDGFNLSDLWQVGTDLPSQPGGASQPFAWFEFLPPEGQQMIQTTGTDGSGKIVNFTVSEGDQIFAGVMIGDDNQVVTPGGSVLWYFLENWTTNVSTGWTRAPVTPQQVQAASIGGTEAEWIVERPSFSGTPAQLANYTTFEMDSLASFDNNGWDVNPIGSSTTQIQMVNGSNETLNSVGWDSSSSFHSAFVKGN